MTNRRERARKRESVRTKVGKSGYTTAGSSLSSLRKWETNPDSVVEIICQLIVLRKPEIMLTKHQKKNDRHILQFYLMYLICVKIDIALFKTAKFVLFQGKQDAFDPGKLSFQPICDHACPLNFPVQCKVQQDQLGGLLFLECYPSK